MSAKSFITWSGIALLLWALHLLVRDFIFAFTHGSSQADMGQTFHGLTWGTYSAVWTAFPLLGVVGLAGVYAEVSPRIGRSGRAGLVLAIVGLALLFVAGVLQYWIPGLSFYSPLYTGAWYLSLLGLLVGTIGLIVAGLDIRRADALTRGRSAVLLIGLLAVPGILVRSWVVMNSPDALSWKLLYVSTTVPWEVCWAWLGVALILAARGPTRSLQDPTPLAP